MWVLLIRRPRKLALNLPRLIFGHYLHANVCTLQSVKTDLYLSPKRFSRPMEEVAQRRVGAFILDIVCVENPINWNATYLGLIMSMHLFVDSPIEPQPSASNSLTKLKLLCAYESGTVTQWRFSSSTKVTSVEGIGWEATWTVKLHVETGRLP